MSGSFVPAPGVCLAQWTLLELLGRGGMGEVWFGRDPSGAISAVKTMAPDLAAQEKFRRMFLDEAAIASRVTHENVAQVLGAGEEGGIPFIAFELVDGEPLSRVAEALGARGEPLAPDLALSIAADLCGALAAAHAVVGSDGVSLEIVHRDVSPHNVVIDDVGRAKLIDFGVARARERIAGETNTGGVRGKVAYMAPEQALGDRVDRRADLWSVGAVVFELVTGKAPLGADAVARLRAAAQGTEVDLARAGLGPGFEELLRRALAHDREARFESADEMGEAIAAERRRRSGSSGSRAALREALSTLLPIDVARRRARSARLRAPVAPSLPARG